MDKVDWTSLCCNNNIPIEFFEKHLNKVNWITLRRNDFKNYFKKLEIKENKKLLRNVFEQITGFIYLLPLSSFSCVPRGGSGYLEMVKKYEDF